MRGLTRSAPIVLALVLAMLAAGTDAHAATDFKVRVTIRWISCAMSADRQQSAEREASAIWRRAGVALDWVPLSQWRKGDLEVVIADELPIPSAATAATPMGMTLFAEGRPAARLYVSAFAALDAAQRERRFSAWAASLPDKVVVDAAVRLVGRAIAHEIGHVLLGPGHTDGGLMRRVFTAADGMTMGPAGYGLTNGERRRIRERLTEGGVPAGPSPAMAPAGCAAATVTDRGDSSSVPPRGPEQQACNAARPISSGPPGRD